VDTAGNLPRGEAFKTFAEFKQLIVKHYQADMVRGLMKNFVVYSTGRKPGIDDMADIAATLTELRAKDYPLRDLLKATVRSRAFLEQHQSATEQQPSPVRKPQ